MGKKREEESGGNWMDTYGDMVTLLFTFFVMLYSMSSVNEDKWAMLVRAFNIHGSDVVEQIVMGISSEADGSDPFENKNDANSVGPEDKDIQEEIDELFANIQQYIQQHEMQDSIALSLGNDFEESVGQENQADKNNGLNGQNGDEAKNIYIQFKNDVLFMPNSSIVRNEAKDIIKFLGKCLSGVEKDIAMVIVKGHIANAPDDDSVDSRLLSTDRAATITNMLEKEYKMPSNKLYPIGLSGDYPIASNDTEEGRKQNRRVEIVIISKNSPLAKSGELMKILGASFTTNSGNIQEIAGETADKSDSVSPSETAGNENSGNAETPESNINPENSADNGNNVDNANAESSGGGNYGDSASRENSGE